MARALGPINGRPTKLEDGQGVVQRTIFNKNNNHVFFLYIKKNCLHHTVSY